MVRADKEANKGVSLAVIQEEHRQAAAVQREERQKIAEVKTTEKSEEVYYKQGQVPLQTQLHCQVDQEKYYLNLDFLTYLYSCRGLVAFLVLILFAILALYKNNKLQKQMARRSFFSLV